MPVLSEIGDHSSVFRNDVLARYESHVVIAAHAVAVLHDVAEFDERVPPIDRIERKAAELLEPGLVEVVQRLVALITCGVHELERFCHDKTLTLANAAGEVPVGIRVAVDVVESLPVGVINVDGELPRLAPVGDVLTGECVGGLL